MKEGPSVKGPVINGWPMCARSAPLAADIGSTCIECDHSNDLHRRSAGSSMPGFPVPYCLGCLMDALANGPHSSTPRSPRKSRTIRAEDELWDAALRKADERGEVLSEEVREFLQRYAKMW